MSGESFANVLTLFVNDPKHVLSRHVDTNGVMGAPAIQCTADFQSVDLTCDYGYIQMKGRRTCSGDIVEDGTFALTYKDTDAFNWCFFLVNGTRTFPDGTIERGSYQNTEDGYSVSQCTERVGRRRVHSAAPVMVFNSVYTGPLPRYPWCSSGAVLRSRSAVPQCLVG